MDPEIAIDPKRSTAMASATRHLSRDRGVGLKAGRGTKVSAFQLGRKGLHAASRRLEASTEREHRPLSNLDAALSLGDFAVRRGWPRVCAFCSASTKKKPFIFYAARAIRSCGS